MEKNIMKKTTLVVDKNNYRGHVQTILYDGVCPYTNKTADEYIAEGYTVMTDDEYNKFYQEYERSLCNDWSEVTEEKYWDALEVLPPKKWYDGGFYMGECYMGTLYSFYQKWNGKYYTSLQSICKPRNEILDNLKKFIAERTETA